jgi:hypothetical protein
LWDGVINPACLRWSEETGKPAEAYREAIAGGFEKPVMKLNTWNAWQRGWWNGLPDIEDEGLQGKFLAIPLILYVLTTPCSEASREVSGGLSSKSNDTGG